MVMIWSYDNNEIKLIFCAIIMYTDLEKSLEIKLKLRLLVMVDTINSI